MLFHQLETNLAITEIQSLEIGDVIVLDNHSVNDPIRLTIWRFTFI